MKDVSSKITLHPKHGTFIFFLSHSSFFFILGNYNNQNFRNIKNISKHVKICAQINSRHTNQHKNIPKNKNHLQQFLTKIFIYLLCIKIDIKNMHLTLYMVKAQKPIGIELIILKKNWLKILSDKHHHTQYMVSTRI